jgi:hypothetical protein
MRNEKKEKNVMYFDVGISSTPDPLLANMAKPQQYLPHIEKKGEERGKGGSYYCSTCLLGMGG